MRTFLRDLSYAARILKRCPMFAGIAVLTLALGIGANTAIFGLINAFLLRSLPVEHPEQLVFIERSIADGNTESDFPLKTFEFLRDNNKSLSSMAAFDATEAAVNVNGQAEFVNSDFVTGEYFPLLRAHAWVGRLLSPDDDTPGARATAVISYSYWRQRFAADPSVVGKRVLVGGIPFTIVGVTPPQYHGRHVQGETPAITLPMLVQPRLALKDHDTFDVIGRLKPGVNAQGAAAELNVAYRNFLSAQRASLEGARAEMIALRPALHGYVRDGLDRELRILFAAVAVALLIGCINLANLLLARSVARQNEIAVRLAIGASRGRLIRQLLTETLLLAMLGGIAAVVLSAWMMRALLLVISKDIPFTPASDWRVLAFASGLSVLTAIVFGLAPAILATRPDVNVNLKGKDKSETKTSYRTLGRTLATSQIALALVLVIVTGLLIRSLRELYRVDTGYDRKHVVMGWVFPSLLGYSHERELALYSSLQEKLNAVPGVESASLSRFRIVFGQWRRPVWIAGQGLSKSVQVDIVGTRFFATAGIPLIAGREFSSADTPVSMPVAIISESTARALFPGRNPIGQRFGFDAQQPRNEVEVIGVARDILHHPDAEPNTLAAYIPYTQAPDQMLGQINMVVRTSSAATVDNSLRQVVASIDRNLPVVGVASQIEDIADRYGDQHSIVTLLKAFSGFALLLAATGLYGTMAYFVGRRTREIGIRIALGARTQSLLWIVLGETMFMVAVAVTVAAVLSLAATRLVSSMIFGIGRLDPLTIATSAAVMSAVALLAGYLPARRATKVDPMVALRYE